jgi:ELWxxDGT repeat protein
MSRSRSAVVPLLVLAAALFFAPPAAAAVDGPAELLTGVDPHTLHPGPDCHILCPGPPPPSFGAVPRYLTRFGERLFFVAGDEEHGFEPWVSDGTEVGTLMLADLCPGECTSEPVPIGALDGAGGAELFFWAETPAAGREPWITDGTSAGTRLVEDLCPGPCSSGNGLEAALLQDGGGGLGAALAGRLLFGADEGDGTALYASDGSAAGTGRIAGLCTGFCWQLPGDFTLSGSLDRVYFTAKAEFGSGDEGLWITDGTAAGTRRVDLGCAADAFAAHLVAFRDGIAFAGGCVDRGVIDQELHVHRGPAAAAATLLGVDDVVDLAVLGDHVFALRGGFGPAPPPWELWASDGTPAGTERRRELDWPVHRLEAAAGALYLFARLDEEPPFELDLFTTDGSNEPVQVNTAPVDGATTFSRHGGRALWWERPDALGPKVYEWRLVSHAADDGHKVEQAFTTPWVAVDLVTVQEDVPPLHRAAGSHLFLSANGGGGVQLWGMDAAEIEPTCFDDPFALCLWQGRFQLSVRVRNQHAGGAERRARPDAASRQIAGDTGYFWFFRPDNLELAVKVLDARGVDGHWWVFAGGPTDLEYDLVVTDLTTDRTRSYRHAPGDLCSVVDTAAFSAAGTGGGLAAAPAARVAAPLSPPPDPECDPDNGRACVGPGDRFSLAVTWYNQHAGGTEGTASVHPETPDTAVARFFPNGGVEVMVKVLDGRPVNGHWWVLWGGLTDLGYTVEVLDRETETVRTFTNPPGSLCGGAGTTAFAETP